MFFAHCLHQAEIRLLTGQLI
jgi:serine/threonine-protein kinase Chk2